jgi:signal transduction histidine kinase
MITRDLWDLLVQKTLGTIELGGARIALLDIESGFWSIRRQVEMLIGTGLTSTVLQQAGANGGASFAQNFIPNHSFDAPQTFSTCVQIYQVAGFGQFEIASLEWPLGRILIQANQTFEAWAQLQNDQPSPSPCCAYTAGVLVGFINVISNRKDVVCIEHFCQGKGDPYCQFELLPADQAADQTVVALTPDPGLGRQLNLLEILFERMPMGIAVLDREYRIQRFNPTWNEFAERYAPPSGKPLAPGVGYFEHLPGSEPFILPLFERSLAGENIRQDNVRLESEGVVTFWDVVLAPLYEQGRVVGILNVAVDATERVAALQNLEQRVEERTQEINRRREVAESLRDMMVVLNSEQSPREIFDYITARSANLLRADACMIYSVQDQLLTKESGYNLPESFSELQSGELYLGDANKSLLDGHPVQINDALSYLNGLLKKTDLTDFQSRWYQAIRENFASYFAFPLVVRGVLFGGLVFYFKSKHDFDEEDLQLGVMLGEQAALAIENTRLYQAEQIRQRELQILLDVAEAANSSLDLDEIVSKTLDLLVDLISASRAGVILVDESTGQLGPYILRPSREIPPEDLARIIRASQMVADNGEMLYIDPDPAAGLPEPGALLPLQTRGKNLGILGIIGSEDSTFTPKQLALFKSIADQLGIAIENAYLFEKAEQAAITAERNRLSRDLHDAVTQTLFSASMIADVLPKIWERKPAEGQRRLEELRQLTRGALSEMRTLLVELRPAALEDTDLGDLIGHQVNAFTARTRIPVTFERASAQNPSPEIKETFYRIVQEAFNNIAKHAEATTVQVLLDCQPGRAELVIEDDGLGFEPEIAQTEGLGLGIMAERARSAGAQLEIHSQIGEGTQLRLLWSEA